MNFYIKSSATRLAEILLDCEVFRFPFTDSILDFVNLFDSFSKFTSLSGLFFCISLAFCMSISEVCADFNVKSLIASGSIYILLILLLLV